MYGDSNLVVPVLIETVDSFGNRTFTNSQSIEHVDWDVLSGWYFAMLATLLLIPTVLFGLLMKNKREKVVRETTTRTTVKEQAYVAPVKEQAYVAQPVQSGCRRKLS